MTTSVDGRALREAAAGMLAARISPRFLEEHGLLPLAIEDGVLMVATGQPLTPVLTQELRRFFGVPVREVAVPREEVRAALLGVTRDHTARGLASDTDVLAPLAIGDAALEGVSVGDRGPRPVATDGPTGLGVDEAPVITLVNGVLRDALRGGASDVHIEPTEDGLRIRLRLDGVLQEVARPPREYREAVLSRVKILAGLDIGERRLPQDGRVRLRLDGREVDLRVSSLPSLHGESLVLRILDHAGGARSLAELGVPADVSPVLEQLLARASGMTLVTGPTGSGKTTTLYAALALRNQPGVKVITVEDPVEYRIPGVVQVPVNRKAGLGFAHALRAMLRHDPDVIMIGEMRDAETASIAMRAALTGHQVLSTLHTTDAVSAVVRLVDMGIEPYLVASTLHGIVAQRLVRVLCEQCAVPTDPPPGRAAASWRRAVGCSACVGTGYRGRVGLFEVVTVSDPLRAAIVRGASLEALRQMVREEGTVPLREAGLALAARGVTTQEEVLRVVEA